MPDLDFAALFLASVSPGQVVRIAERLDRSTPGAVPAADFLLSDPAGALGLRLLTTDRPEQPAGLERLGAGLSRALGSRVTLLWRRRSASSGEWGASVWEAGEVTETAAGPFLPAATNSWRARLSRVETPVTPDAAWARAHKLPLDRLPTRNARVQRIAYETVAALDRKSLLAENSPRFYTFTIGAPAKPPTV